MALPLLDCTYAISKVAFCPPSLQYRPLYFFAKYPRETTKLWNLTKLLTPKSWILTFSATLSIVIMLKRFTVVGTFLGCRTTVQDVTLVPLRYNKKKMVLKSLYLLNKMFLD